MPRPPTKKPTDPDLARLEPRERLIACGRELFQQKTYEGVNIREIMQLAGVNQSTIYYFFQNKDGLFLASLLNLVEEIDLEFNRALRHNSFQQQLRALANLFNQPPAPNLPQLFADLDKRIELNRQISAQGISQQTARPALVYVNQTWPRALENALKEARRSGEIQIAQPAFIAHFLLTLLTAYPQTPFNLSTRTNPDYNINTLLDFINKSLKTLGSASQI